MSEGSGEGRLIADRYRLLSPIGRGGMGTVWRAMDELLRREVAVKEVHAPAGLSSDDVERTYARLEREAWAAARVANRNVVTVYDVATDDGRPWIVMELVRGISLADLLDAEGPLPPRRAAHIGAEVLSALRAAYAVGVLHRDVKPANVLLSNDDRVVLTDFGIATVEGSSALTLTGEVIGSPEFLAPERALGRTPGLASDLWSLGVLLYAEVEGHSPFRHDTPLSTLRAIVDEELPPPLHAGPLAPVIEGLLRKDPAERTDPEQAERDLRAVAAGAEPSAYAAPTVPYAAAGPRTGATRRQEPAAGFGPPPGTGTADTPSSTARDGGGRRTTIALVAGFAALALVVAGLTYALLQHDGDDGEASGGATTASDTGGPTASVTASESGDGPSASASSEPEKSPSSSAPEQSVKVSLSGSHTEYSGTCPPPGGQAPTFTATFTVGRLPAQVSYRWVTRDGSVSDAGWKTLSFAAGGSDTKRDQVTVTTGADGGKVEDEISVEVREPVRTTSDAQKFEVDCETETPSDGTSASATASP
ncbi:protein kinase [Streptomyces sp. NPDC090306]|uniref:serine/threonine-protein kinase n=1 Tax=Streptomyces sp. NPDC090306 TaxID=3365961 RepID=UPI0037FD56C9